MMTFPPGERALVVDEVEKHLRRELEALEEKGSMAKGVRVGVDFLTRALLRLVSPDA